MFKKLIKFLLGFNTFAAITTTTINTANVINQINYSEAVQKVNNVRNKIDEAIETLTKIQDGIDKKRDALKDDGSGSANLEFYSDQNPHVLYKINESGKFYSSWPAASNKVQSCSYWFYGEQIFLNPYYITTVSAISNYVITSWAGYSWDTMKTWFNDSSVAQYEVRLDFKDLKYYMNELDKDKEFLNLKGKIEIKKPNSAIYLEAVIESSDKGKILNEKNMLKVILAGPNLMGILCMEELHILLQSNQ